MKINKKLIGNVYDVVVDSRKDGVNYLTIIDVIRSEKQIKLLDNNNKELYIRYDIFLYLEINDYIIYSKDKNRIRKIKSIINE